MCRKIIFALITLFIISYNVYAVESGILLDDCIDTSLVSGYSEGIYPSEIDPESQSAYESDFTMFMRNEISEEWVEYKISKDTYLVFNTYFRQNEEISHFTFEESKDKEVWTAVSPQIKIRPVDNYKWIPVTYTLKSVKSDSEYIRIKFSNKNAVEWSPMIASVYSHYRTKNISGFADCIDTPYNDSVSLLKNLGFVNGYNEYEYKPYNNITRAEFAKIIADIINIGKGGAEVVFSDVSDEYWACGYIAALYRQGIINGDENGNFKPEDSVTYTEAAKMIINAIGYSLSAKDAGGYPSGYLVLAERLGIFNEISERDRNHTLSRGDMAIMICNALEVDVFTQTEFGTTASYKKEGNLLEVYHNISIAEGLVEGVDGCNVIADLSVGQDNVVLNGKTYNSTNFDMSDFLGMSVILYHKENTVLYAKCEAEKVINISAADFIRLDDSKIYYDNGEKNESNISVNNNTRIVYNGRYKSRIGVCDDFGISCGDIKIICNEKNVADVIIIKEYKKYIPITDGNIDDIINDRITGAVNLNLNKADKLFLKAYGEKVDLANASYVKGDVICVAESEDGKVIYVDILDNNISGTVEYYNATNMVMIINGEEYKHIENINKLGKNISVGADVIAYCDINGRIFAIDNINNEEYVYLIESGEASVFSDSVNLKLLLQSGEIQIFNITNQTKFNDKRNCVKTISGMQPQLLKIKRRANGEIAEIFTADDVNLKMEFSSEDSKYYGGTLCVFASKYQIGVNTPIFFIPDSNEDKKYKVINRYNLYSDFNYNVKIYDISEEFVSGAVVIFENGSRNREVDSYDEVAVIRSVEQITNAEGELCLNVSVFVKGQEKNIYFDNEGGVDNTWNWIPDYERRDTADGNNPFSVGEVLQFYSDSESHCRSYRMMLTDDMVKNNIYYEKNTGDYGALNNENYFSELYTAYGNVKNRFSNKLLITTDENILRTIPIESCAVYVYDNTRNTLRIANSNDIHQGSNVFVRMVYGETTDIIVFE